jgi:hypothetical protein
MGPDRIFDFGRFFELGCPTTTGVGGSFAVFFETIFCLDFDGRPHKGRRFGKP